MPLLGNLVFKKKTKKAAQRAGGTHASLQKERPRRSDDLVQAFGVEHLLLRRFIQQFRRIKVRRCW